MSHQAGGAHATHRKLPGSTVLIWNVADVNMRPAGMFQCGEYPKHGQQTSVNIPPPHPYLKKKKKHWIEHTTLGLGGLEFALRQRLALLPRLVSNLHALSTQIILLPQPTGTTGALTCSNKQYKSHVLLTCFGTLAGRLFHLCLRWLVLYFLMWHWLID